LVKIIFLAAIVPDIICKFLRLFNGVLLSVIINTPLEGTERLSQ